MGTAVLPPACVSARGEGAAPEPARRARRAVRRARGVAGLSPVRSSSSSPRLELANAGTSPPWSSMTSLRRRMYTRSRSFHSTSTGVAMKIEE